MTDNRIFRERGETLLLGGTTYRITGVEGAGGSCVVYRATYEDLLSEGVLHYVLIRELYPWLPYEGIRRDECGNIVCTEEAQRQMEISRRRFRQANQLNLEMLSRLPSQTSGNLNSYETYGTYYSVLTLHGGKNLNEILNEEKETLTLRRAAELTVKILDALEPFHKNGLLYLDISPENVLILPGQALLIDYNSAFSVTEGQAEDFCASIRDGYTAPEVLLEDFEHLGAWTDLYSVCAVFFRMLTGRTQTEEEWRTGKRKILSKELKIFRDQPDEAVERALQIEKTGLHTLYQKRWQSSEALRIELDGICACIAEHEKKRRLIDRIRMAAAVFTAVIAVLGVGAYELGRYTEKSGVSYSAEQKEDLYRGTNLLLTQLGSLNALISAQKQMLNDVRESGLTGEASIPCSPENARYAYEKTVSRALSANSVGDSSRILELLDEADAGSEAMREMVSDLYGRAEQMKAVMTELTDWLEYCLFDCDIYTRERKKDFVDAYEEWLDVYTRVCGYEVCAIRGSLDEKSAELLEEGMAYMDSLGVAYSELTGKSGDEYRTTLNIQKEQKLKKSQEDLNNLVKASNDTTGQNFQIAEFES